MPTYEFRCPKGHEFERFYRKISDAPSEVTCPECGALAERQLSGGAGLLFKGSGFYLTDYGKNAHRKPEPRPESDKAEAPKSEGAKPTGESGGARGGGEKSETSKAERTKPKVESPKLTSEGRKPKKE